MRLAWRVFALVLLAPWAFGCRMIEPPSKGHSPLAPLVSDAQQMTLEIFSAPIAVNDPRLAALWAEVDEQPLAPELRRKLHDNGIRAGVAGPQVPASLTEFLQVTDQPIPLEDRSLVPLEAEPGVQLRVLQPHPGKRNDIVLSPVYEQVSILKSSDGQLEGKTYAKAEARLQLRASPEADGRIRLDLLPELHHGELKTHITGSASDGMMVWKPERSKQLYSDMKLSVALRSGQMFLVTCDSNRPSSIGHWFFMQQGAEKPTQKLWVIRLAQASADRSFAEAPEPTGEVVISDEVD